MRPVLHASSPSPHLTSPHLTSPHLTSPHLTSPHLTSPHLTSPHLGQLGRFRGRCLTALTTPHVATSMMCIRRRPIRSRDLSPKPQSHSLPNVPPRKPVGKRNFLPLLNLRLSPQRFPTFRHPSASSPAHNSSRQLITCLAHSNTAKGAS
ncbi:hypothetical protein BGZ61DRAFT_184395 [Ilyonectria robusta]|uniref:uncharacterized protein n=1 Tax=Ilyonectria robusta TaxID=1079257 RepID=UPI001E8CCA59|nr:uncharacterized protein BGZ61DRAFT_184395 [Ilyonectria robusta]KAH8729583.1 hypothetical protein BGZ61DRAFT_184395 [Ilyonectria robusta]